MLERRLYLVNQKLTYIPIIICNPVHAFYSSLPALRPPCVVEFRGHFLPCVGLPSLACHLATLPPDRIQTKPHQPDPTGKHMRTIAAYHCFDWTASMNVSLSFSKPTRIWCSRIFIEPDCNHVNIFVGTTCVSVKHDCWANKPIILSNGYCSVWSPRHLIFDISPVWTNSKEIRYKDQLTG